MPLDFSDLVPEKKARKPNGFVDFLNRHAGIPQKVLDFIPKLGEGAVRAAATLPTTAFSKNPSAKIPAARAFVVEPFTPGGKSLPERAIELQAEGEQTLSPRLRKVARALGPTTAIGAELAAGFGDPLNLALGKGAMLRSPTASIAEAFMGTSGTAATKAAAVAEIPKASPFTLLRLRDRAAEQIAKESPELGAAIRGVSLRGVRTIPEAESRLNAALPSQAPDSVRSVIADWAKNARAELNPGGTATDVPEPLKPLAKALELKPEVPPYSGAAAFEASTSAKTPLSPKQAKQVFRTRQRIYQRDLKKLDASDLSASARRLATPKAPEFKNVLPPGKRPIALEPPGSARFPTEELRSAAVSDPAPFKLQRETLDRNIEAAFGEQAGPVKAYLSDPLKQDVTAAAEFSSRLRNELDNVFRGLRIRRGSDDDFLAADFIEGNVTLEEIGKLIGAKRTKAIEVAAEAGRIVYRDLLKRINATLKAYGYKPVAERQNYVTHTRQMGAFLDRLGSFLAGGQDTLPTEISAINVDTKPGRQFFAFGKKRKGNSTHEGLITALDKYLDPAVRQIHVTPSVQRFRAFQKALVKLLPEEDSTRLSNFNSYLGQLTNMLAGKQNIIDRPIEKVFGRKFLRVFDGLRRRTGANLVGGSVSAALTNYIPLTQALATTSKPAITRALFEALAVPFKDPAVIDGVKSAFLTRRFPTNAIAPTLGMRAKDAASWLFRAVDHFTSNTVVGGKYYEGLRHGLSKAEAMKIADDYAARLMADRSFGQQPLLFNSKTLGALTQFQVEVNNQLSFLLKDVPKNLKLNRRQVASSLTQVAIYSYLFNELYERAVGRRPALDPIHAVVNLVGKISEGAPVTDFINPADQNTPVGEITAALPFTSIAAGGRVPIGGSLPDLVAVLGGKATLSQELQKPLYALLPPTGGSQARKTIKGVQAYNRGYSETPTGRLRFSIDEDPVNLLRSALFGEYSTPQAREYFKSK